LALLPGCGSRTGRRRRGPTAPAKGVVPGAGAAQTVAPTPTPTTGYTTGQVNLNDPASPSTSWTPAPASANAARSRSRSHMGAFIAGSGQSGGIIPQTSFTG